MGCCQSINIIILLFLKLIPARGDIFSAVVDLEPLIITQGDTISQLEKVINEKKCKIKVVKEYLKISKEEQSNALKNIPLYVANPINSFRLIKRLSVDFDYMEALLKDISDFRKNLSLTYPTVEDLDGTANSLIRLESMYNLEVTHMANGSWHTKNDKGGRVYLEHTSPMTTSDCLELGKALCREKYFKHCINWINEAISKFDGGVHDDGRYSRDEITDELNKAHEGLGVFITNLFHWLNDLRALTTKMHDVKIEELVKHYRNGLSVEEARLSLEKDLHDESNERTIAVRKSDGLEHLDLGDAAYQLCRDEIKLPLRLARKLKCYYAFAPHPFLKIAPIKTEQIHKAPDVLLLHDVISDGEIRNIIDLTKGHLSRGEVTTGDWTGVAPGRLCKVAFLNDTDFSRKLEFRISALSGLDVSYSGKLHVANYGLGGHYDPHYDFWRNETFADIHGNRIATILFYLSDVEQGGATVFLRLGLTVFPKKGAALFWPNLLPATGQGDYNSLHAACPVLKGSKWVLTQWINMRGQELKRGCRRSRS